MYLVSLLTLESWPRSVNWVLQVWTKPDPAAWLERWNYWQVLESLSSKIIIILQGSDRKLQVSVNHCEYVRVHMKKNWHLPHFSLKPKLPVVKSNLSHSVCLRRIKGYHTCTDLSVLLCWRETRQRQTHRQTEAKSFTVVTIKLVPGTLVPSTGESQNLCLYWHCEKVPKVPFSSRGTG